MKSYGTLFLLFLFGFFLSWFFLYKAKINTLPIQSEDTLPTMFIPVTVLKEGTLYVDSYYDMLVERYPHPDDRDYTLGLTPYYLKKIEVPTCGGSLGPCPLAPFASWTKSHYVTAFPIITGLLVIPLYAPYVLLNQPITWEALIYLSHLGAAAIVSLVGVLFYFFLSKYQNVNRRHSLFLTLILMFGTVNYSMLSQSLWQHGTVELFGVLCLISIFSYLNTKKTFYLILFGFFVGLAVLSRPTAILYGLLIFLVFYSAKDSDLITKLKVSVYSGLGLLPCATFFIWYNNKYFSSIQNQGYADQFLTEWKSNIIEGFLGQLISPSKGILIYSPVLIFSLVGVYFAVKKYKSLKNVFTFQYLLYAFIIFVHILVLGKWKHWYGGYSYGYRMASDILPLLVLLLIPYLNSPIYQKTKRWFFVLFGISVLIQIHGLVFFDGIWHNAYDDGYEDTRWLWSIRDSEFAFNIRRILVKFNLLDRACPKCLPGP